jgi:hypothetical protein
VHCSTLLWALPVPLLPMLGRPAAHWCCSAATGCEQRMSDIMPIRLNPLKRILRNPHAVTVLIHTIIHTVSWDASYGFSVICINRLVSYDTRVAVPVRRCVCVVVNSLSLLSDSIFEAKAKRAPCVPSTPPAAPPSLPPAPPSTMVSVSLWHRTWHRRQQRVNWQRKGGRCSERNRPYGMPQAVRYASTVLKPRAPSCLPALTLEE